MGFFFGKLKRNKKSGPSYLHKRMPTSVMDIHMN